MVGTIDASVARCSAMVLQNLDFEYRGDRIIVPPDRMVASEKVVELIW